MAKPSAGFLFYCPDDNTVLLTRRSESMNRPGTWDVQGGRWDEGDDGTLETANREAHEELGTLPRNKSLVARHELPRSKTHKSKYVVFIYAVSLDEKKRWTPQIKIDHETSAYKWFPLDEMPQDTHFDLSWLGSELL